jgi:putative FmdB family regulatory protein
MPLYEYLCESCGRRTEALQRLDDPPLSVCPHCEGPLRKLLSAPAFQFKGSGWYLTDYARKAGGEAGGAKPAGGDSGKPAASSESAGETKSSAEPAKGADRPKAD